LAQDLLLHRACIACLALVALQTMSGCTRLQATLLFATLACIGANFIKSKGGCQCTDKCETGGDVSGTWCHTLQSGSCGYSWDYCTPKSPFVVSASGCRCSQKCGKNGESFTWCNTGDDCKFSWDYCKPKSQNEDVAKDVAGHDPVADVPADMDSVPDCPSCGTKFQLTKKEIGEALAIQNKMRKAVGTPPLKWNCKLMCQAQKWADRCEFAHSDNYNSPIPAGENLASGQNVITAAWMWFSEYGSASPTSHATFNEGHFTALVWKSTKDLGCGACKSGKGVYLCQYANSKANYGGESAFKANVPPFRGTAAQYKAGGLDPVEAKEQLKKFQGWGLNIGNALSRFYENDDDTLNMARWAPNMMLPALFVLAMVFLAATTMAIRRRSGVRDMSLDADADAEQLLEE